MRGISTELKVGIFTLLAISLLAFMTFKAGGLEWAKSSRYKLFVYFDNTAGLDEKTKVRVAGVDAGMVDGIILVGGRAKVKLLIDTGVKIHRDAGASIRSTGLLGDKFLDIDIGSSDAPLLKDGDTIENVTELVNIDDLARGVMLLSERFSRLTDSLNEVLGTDEAKVSLKETIVNLRNVTAGLNRTIDTNNEKLSTVLDNINKLVASIDNLVEKNSEPLTDAIADMREFSGALRTNGPEAIESLNRASRELRALVEENRPVLKSTMKTLNKVTERIDKGEGFIGKLVKDEKLYDSLNRAAEGLDRNLSAVDRFRTFLTFQAEYLTKPEDAKGYFYLTLQPRKDTSYILGVVGDPVRTVRVTETATTPPGTVITEEKKSEKIEFTAHYVKRFGDADIRLGLTENTFGIGGDYFFLNDRGKITADAWDFSNDEEYSDNPHLKLGLDYFLFEHFFLSAGADNILNKRWRGGYIGMGVRFMDEDFKYLLNSLPSISTN